MTSEYAKWRDGEVHRLGGKVQRDAEAIADQQGVPKELVRVCDEKSGMHRMANRRTAEVMIKKGEWSKSKTYSIPK